MNIFRSRRAPSDVDTFASARSPQLTFVDSASGHKEASLKRVAWSQMDALIGCLKALDLKKHYNLRREALAYIEEQLTGQDEPDDIARLTDIEEEVSEAARHGSPTPEVIAAVKTPLFGKAQITTWKKINIEDLPLVVFKHTQLTKIEKDKIADMEIPALLDIVRKECPERESVLFPSGYDAMEVAKMRRRLVNQLRLNLDELTELLYDGTGAPRKKKLLNYLIRIRPGLIKGTN